MYNLGLSLTKEINMKNFFAGIGAAVILTTVFFISVSLGFTQVDKTATDMTYGYFVGILMGYLSYSNVFPTKEVN